MIPLCVVILGFQCMVPFLPIDFSSNSFFLVSTAGWSSHPLVGGVTSRRRSVVLTSSRAGPFETLGEDKEGEEVILSKVPRN